MSKLQWEGRATADGRLLVQSEQVRGEGVHYYLLGMSRIEQDVAKDFDIETCFFGRGGVSKVKEAAQRIVDLAQHRVDAEPVPESDDAWSEDELRDHWPAPPVWAEEQAAEAKAADDERSGVHPVSQGSAMDITGQEAGRPGGWHPQLLEAFGQYPKTGVRHLRQTVLDEVAFERARQIAVEGYDSAHDDGHDLGQIARAGASYALAASGWRERGHTIWPWDRSSFKTGYPEAGWRRRCLIKAMALLCAEVERLDRDDG